MFKININGKDLEFDTEIRLSELEKDKRFICAKVNNRLRELSYIVHSDCKVEFLDIMNINAMRVYETTLRFIVLKALNNIRPNESYKYLNGVCRSYLLASIDDDVCLNSKLLKDLRIEVSRLISDNLVIERVKVTKEEARIIYEKQKMFDKLEVMEYRKTKYVNLYKCGKYYNYLYGYMMPSTGYVDNYAFRLHNPGILVSYPRVDLAGKIPKYQPNNVYDNIIIKAQDEADFLKVSNVSELNRWIKNGDSSDLINISEAMHSRKMVELSDQIEKNIRNIKLIGIAGPSSSSKTTFTNKLRVELISRGIKPVMISIDDYYYQLKDIPLDNEGNYDFETIDALDLERFNKDLFELIQGKTVKLRKRVMATDDVIEYGREVTLSPNSPIIIEGIHALNDKLTNTIPNKNKFKIYISPVLALNIDNHSPINLTDARMLRRIVRDRKFRNFSASRTLNQWKSVRAGEFKWVYPYNDNVDWVFNTNLLYEIAVMKNYAFEALSEIDNNSEFFIEANRLLKFLRYISKLDEMDVPCNSLLREFIGGSSFRE
jgi:uridine kinase